MKRLLACVLLPLLGSAGLAAQPAPANPATADQAALARGNNAFAVDLYGHLSTQPGNLFFSPASISTAFAMAYAGARGQTAAQMAHVFHFTLPPDRLNPAIGALLRKLNAPHPEYELRVADALWAERNAPFAPAYLKVMQTDYAADFRRVDFQHAPEAVRGTINQWVAQETNNRIENLIGPGVLTPQTRLVLTNAIYFKGTWAKPFEKSATNLDGEFHLSSTQTARTPLMHRSGRYPYYDGGTFQELELPYASGNQAAHPADELAMIVLLPKETDGLPALEKQFTAEAASQWLAKLEPADKIILTLPRFTMTQQFELSGVLASMGMPQAFTGAADFSGMTGKPEFSISAAIHKAFVDVNEKGTEAAAATSTIMMATAMRMPQPEPPPIVFRADHPFLFLIRDTTTGEILFLGRVEDPAKN
ncbi:MAG TPA: serpin family protein [Acidobacteriaceae bacterium]|jgi:serpin B|nr:serpin family protein [Acidobacteriaceae bacterium]